MADWPVIGGGDFAKQLNPNAATSSVTAASQITCGANDTKNAWAEVVSSTDENYGGIYIFLLRQIATNASSIMIDLAIGASGSEEILIENISFSPGTVACVNFFLPIFIPSGSRITARGQTNNINPYNVYVSLIGVSAGFLYQSYQKVDTYGAATATTEGVNLPVTANHTKGNYAEITSATTREIKFLIIDVLWSQSTTSANRNFLFDIAVGASGSEQVIISNVYAFEWEAENVYPTVITLPVLIPAGSRIAARTQQTYNSSAYTIQLVLHGLS